MAMQDSRATPSVEMMWRDGERSKKSHGEPVMALDIPA
jgi:hypothetical protein